MNTRLAHAGRWLFPLWFGILYGWGIWNLLPDPNKSVCSVSAGEFFALLCGPASLRVGIFTVCMLGYGLLFWWLHSPRWPGWSPTWYVIVQFGLIVVVSVLVSNVDILLILSLALIFDALTCRPLVRIPVVFACGALVLFPLIILPSSQKWGINWELILENLFGPLAIGVFALGYFLLYWQAEQARAQQRAVYQKLEAAHRQLQAQSSHIEVLTRQTERQRLARELHDTLAQGLVGVLMQLQVAESRLTHGRTERAQEALQQAMIQVSGALAEARSAIDELRMHPQSFRETVQDAIARFEATTGVPCECDLSALHAIPVQAEEQALRLITEGLTNVARHAQASQVWVTVTRQSAIAAVEVRDNGKGFDPATIPAEAGHYGLLGLQERALLVGGYLEIQSAAMQGTILRLLISLEQERDVPHASKTLERRREPSA
jgi:NarL family two-component system sensor histidine kinase YdfH